MHSELQHVCSSAQQYQLISSPEQSVCHPVMVMQVKILNLPAGLATSSAPSTVSSDVVFNPPSTSLEDLGKDILQQMITETGFPSSILEPPASVLAKVSENSEPLHALHVLPHEALLQEDEVPVDFIVPPEQPFMLGPDVAMLVQRNMLAAKVRKQALDGFNSAKLPIGRVLKTGIAQRGEELQLCLHVKHSTEQCHGLLANGIQL